MLILGQPDDAEASARDNETHVPPNSLSSQPRNPGNQFLVPNQFMQVCFSREAYICISLNLTFFLHFLIFFATLLILPTFFFFFL